MLQHVKKIKEKGSPLSKRKKTRDGPCKGVHTASTKNIHTLHILIEVYDVFNLAKYEKQVCLQILHTYSSTKQSL
jgi:hypothetical protein